MGFWGFGVCLDKVDRPTFAYSRHRKRTVTEIHLPRLSLPRYAKDTNNRDRNEK